ncbi:MAG: bifunctional metallophosphatase/5'-nucleotidase [Desulfovibrio sp.]|jgi:5'-nucleotidase|nr:bifunctional metallophosphatase/5'-nucleotidase [Desulfovibrio sp.]
MNRTLLSAARLSALLAAALLFGCFGAQRGDDVALTILHTNDVHSSYGGFSAENRLCYQALCEGGKGGSVRMDQAIRASRRDRPAALLLDAGDEFQGSLFWTQHREKPARHVVDALGYTAIVPGNHEFDAGNAVFLDYVEALKTPVLAANLSFDPPRAERAGAKRIKPWMIVQRAGHKIGIVGLVTRETPEASSPDPDAHFADEAETAQKAVTELTRQGVDVIVVLSHIGLENDRKLARAVNGIDIIVGGHSHSLLVKEPEKNKAAEGPYPIVENTPEGKPVLIVSTGSTALYLGRLDVKFDAAGVPQFWSGDNIALDDKTLQALDAPPPNERLKADIQTFADPIAAMLQDPIGEIVSDVKNGAPMESPGVLVCRVGECRTGNVVTDALLTIPFAADKPQIVLLNGGALRASLPAGKVTAGDVLGTLPFQNTPVVGTMDGAAILRALEHGVARHGDGGGYFLQVAGLHYAFDVKKPAGGRVVVARVKDGKGQWKPIAPKAHYRVVTLDFLARGGDGFEMFKAVKWREGENLMNDALRVYLEKHSPVAGRLEGRIVQR